MNSLHLTFDYELFFGARTGTLERCAIAPTERLIALAARHNTPFTFFIDAGMLVAMRREIPAHPGLQADYDRIRRQVGTLAKDGHSIQLHIHPHWQDSRYEDGAWKMDTRRYRLDQFSASEVHDIVAGYTAEIAALSDKAPHAFRAGGLCLQPFSHIAPALRAHGIRLDSSVYAGGAMTSRSHRFDFTTAPRKSIWRFEDDPCREVESGFFTEIPITPLRYSQMFFAGMALHRLLKTQKYRAAGDGAGMVGDASRITAVLLKGSNDMASVDGYRVRALARAFERFNARNSGAHFVAIGHPKALSEKSFAVIETLAARHAPAFAPL